MIQWYNTIQTLESKPKANNNDVVTPDSCFLVCVIQLDKINCEIYHSGFTLHCKHIIVRVVYCWVRTPTLAPLIPLSSHLFPWSTLAIHWLSPTKVCSSITLLLWQHVPLMMQHFWRYSPACGMPGWTKSRRWQTFQLIWHWLQFQFHFGTLTWQGAYISKTKTGVFSVLSWSKKREVRRLARIVQNHGIMGEIFPPFCSGVIVEKIVFRCWLILYDCTAKRGWINNLISSSI